MLKPIIYCTNQGTSCYFTGH